MTETRYYAEITVRSVAATSDTFEEEVDEIADALYALEAGASLASDPDGWLITFGVMASGDDVDVALQGALSVVRTALHASGGSTAEWPSAFPRLRESVGEPQLSHC